MILRRYIVTVSGWGEGTILAASRGKALDELTGTNAASYRAGEVG